MTWVVMLLATWIVGMLFQLDALVYGAYVLGAVLLINGWLARSAAENLVVRRSVSLTEGNVGDTVTVLLEVENRGRMPALWFLLEDMIPPEATQPGQALVATGQRLLLAGLRGGKKRTIFYQLKAERRGYFQIGPALLETGDLFGLFRKYSIAAEPHYVLILPRPLPLERYEIASRRPMGEVRLTHRLFEDPTRIAGLRDYRAGDRLNQIHWMASARLGSLQSKFYESTSLAGATFLLDLHVEHANPSEIDYRTELAVLAVASVAHRVFLERQQIGLVTNGRDAADRVRTEGFRLVGRSRKAMQAAVAKPPDNARRQPIVVPTRRGEQTYQELLLQLARLERNDGLDFAELVTETLDRIPADATAIAIVSRLSDDVLVALSLLKRMGRAVVVFANVYEPTDFIAIAGPLMSVGIESRHLRDEETLRTLCNRQESVTLLG